MPDVETDVPAVASRRAAPLSEWRTVLSAVLVSCPVIVLGLLGWQRRWMSDDGFINVRVIHNVFAGHGPVFNVGERVEVGTSTLWLVVMGLAHLLTPSWGVSSAAVVAGLTCSVLGAAAAAAGAWVLWRSMGYHGAALPLGVVVLAALPPVWDFTTSGLEMGLVFLWLGGSFLLLALRLRAARRLDSLAPAWQPLWPALVIGLGPLVRPDLALISLALGIALLAQSRRGVGSWLGAAAAAGALPLTYELLRSGYYATLVPNTALAKSAADSAWGPGLAYLDDYAGSYVLAVPLGVALLVGVPALARRLSAKDVAASTLLLAPVLGGLLHGLYVVRVGGDFMHGRFLLPATFSVLMPVAVVAAAASRLAQLVVPAAVLLVSVWALVVGTTVRVPYAGTIAPNGIADERGVYVTASGSANPVRLGDWERNGWYIQGRALAMQESAGDRLYVDTLSGRQEPVAEDQSVVARTPNIGVLGTAAGPGVLVADSLSLADAVGSRLVLPPPEESRAGHSQLIPEEWHLARYAAPGGTTTEPVRHARESLRCGELAQLQEAITAPMTWDRFWRNVVLAPSLTRLEVPGDPAQARDTFCGTG